MFNFNSNQNIKDFGKLTPEEVMALTIFGEARGESIKGKIGVGTVLLERVQHRN
jgi:spore germination cell wall hydrolase CwlJ-like protein